MIPSADMPFNGSTYYRIIHKHYGEEVGRLALPHPLPPEDVIATFLEMTVLSGMQIKVLESDLIVLREFVIIKHPNGETEQHG